MSERSSHVVVQEGDGVGVLDEEELEDEMMGDSVEEATSEDVLVGEVMVGGTLEEVGPDVELDAEVLLVGDPGQSTTFLATVYPGLETSPVMVSLR